MNDNKCYLLLLSTPDAVLMVDILDSNNEKFVQHCAEEAAKEIETNMNVMKVSVECFELKKIEDFQKSLEDNQTDPNML